MEYMTKVECWSISINRSYSYNIGPSQTSNCFDLNYPEHTLEHTLYIYQYQKIEYKDYENEKNIIFKNNMKLRI